MIVKRYVLTIFALASMLSACGKRSDANSSSIGNSPMNHDNSIKKQETPAIHSYREEEVSYENRQAGVKLAGTLTLPEGSGKFPAVLLIAGYGPSDRNASSMGHKPFLALADYLARRGIAVLRFDKRGVGKSTGDNPSAGIPDLVSDVLAGVAYLTTRPEVDMRALGLIGLSEGGLVASIATSQSKDVAFAVLMAPALATGIDDRLFNEAKQLHADGASDVFIASDRVVRRAILSIAKEEHESTKAKDKIRQAFAEYWAQLPGALKQESQKLPFAFTEQNIDDFASAFTSPVYHYFLTQNPSEVLAKISVPVLVVNGTHDWIVVAERVFAVIEKVSSEFDKHNFTLMKLPNLNHGFRECPTGAMKEYGQGKEAISPIALKAITDWIQAQVAKLK